jgi:paraquat-inducible protein B
MGNVKQNLDRFRSTWYIWLFPLFAVGIAVWLFFGYFDQQGPKIKIRFDDAASIRPDKTRVKFRGVSIGVVDKLVISGDNRDVIAHITLQRDAADFAVEGSRFWVVTPKVNIQGVSGLETLFEGPYIAVDPGPGGAKRKLDFIGQSTKGIEESMEDTAAYYLEAPFVESISVGDPVSFRGLNVGSVTRVTLSKTSQSVLIQINVEAKYMKLIRTNTVFWRKVGLQANLGLFKSEVKINSLESLLRGGVDFFTPDPAGPMAKSRTHFALNPTPPKDWEKWNPKLEYDRKTDLKDFEKEVVQLHRLFDRHKVPATIKDL